MLKRNATQQVNPKVKLNIPARNLVRLRYVITRPLTNITPSEPKKQIQYEHCRDYLLQIEHVLCDDIRKKLRPKRVLERYHEAIIEH